ncbi:MAG: hypothetical protein ACLQM8_12235 [Limisphaerales bacterium]
MKRLLSIWLRMFSRLSIVAATSAIGVLAEAASLPAPKMTFLDNGEVRIGMDLALGGAVTFISSKDHPGNRRPAFHRGRAYSGHE